MTYTITAVVRNEDTITTSVQFTMDDNSIINVDVQHFQPQTVDEITQGIVNRGFSEKRRLDAILGCDGLLQQIQTGVVVTVQNQP